MPANSSPADRSADPGETPFALMRTSICRQRRIQRQAKATKPRRPDRAKNEGDNRHRVRALNGQRRKLRNRSGERRADLLRQRRKAGHGRRGGGRVPSYQTSKCNEDRKRNKEFHRRHEPERVPHLGPILSQEHRQQTSNMQQLFAESLAPSAKGLDRLTTHVTSRQRYLHLIETKHLR